MIEYWTCCDTNYTTQNVCYHCGKSRNGHKNIDVMSIPISSGTSKIAPSSVLAIGSGVSSAKTANEAVLSYSQYMAEYKRSSKTEYDRYCYLYACLQDATISKLECQPLFKLLPSVTLNPNGLRPKKTTQSAISYTADFSYYYQGLWVIEDVKGAYGNSKNNRRLKRVGKPMVTEVSRLRHKMLQAMYPDMVFKIVTNTSEAIETELGKGAA